MESKVMEQIRKMTVGAGEDTKFDIQEIEVQYKLPGVYFLRSAYRFNFDPVPWDKWIVDGEKVRHGREILDLLKEKEIEPKSKEEAINLAKLALLVGEGELRIYPEFDAKGCKKPDAVEKDGAYEATLYISHGFSFQPPMPVKAVFTFGKGVYEKSFERMQSP